MTLLLVSISVIRTDGSTLALRHPDVAEMVIAARNEQNHLLAIHINK